MKLRHKILMISVSLAITQVLLTAFFVYLINYIQIQHADELNPSQKASVLEKAFTAEIIKDFIPLTLLILLLIATTAVLVFVYFERIIASIKHLESIMIEVTQDYFGARSTLKTGDELETLSDAFNRLLDERIKILLIKQGYYNCEMLNNSIIELLKAAFQLSQRDLTVQVPVTEDVTGPLADAINATVIEITQVLLTVQHIGEQMESTSLQMKQQNETLSKHKKAVQEVVNSTASELSAAYDAMTTIAEVTQSCHQMAKHTICSSEAAFKLLNHSLNDLDDIWETMQLLAKKIQNWGTQILQMKLLVALMQSNAQRLQELASNQLMKAEKAAFSKKIEWLHWLAELSIQNLSQLSAWLEKIEKIEIDEAMTIMNKLIRQEVDVASVGERASEQIKAKPTAKVLPVLAQITVYSKQQAQISQDLQEQTNNIQESSQETLKELETQIRQAENLVAYAQDVIKFIQVFKLPAH